MGIFRFKKFSVCDDRATMKVGTDAVLLGAWADVEDINTVLDIGTGSGIIALMIAQRTVDHVTIDAIELTEEDSKQAVENVASSPWPEKVNVVNTSLQSFQSEKKYDLIVCNPPFFSKSLLPPTKERTSVRHDASLSFEELIQCTVKMLSINGNCCIVLPLSEGKKFIEMAEVSKLFLNNKTTLTTRSNKPPERVLLRFGFSISADVKSEDLLLYENNNHWTDNYWNITQEFYLKRH